MKKLIISLLAVVSLTIAVKAQNPSPDTNNPSIMGGLNELWRASRNGLTNMYFAEYTLYAPGLQKKFGGGIAGLYPISQYVEGGVRLDYVNGGFWMPSGNVSFKLPVPLTSWLTITPFTYAGVGVPLSGAQVAGVTFPGGVPKNNNGQPTAILGTGFAVDVSSKLWIFKDLKFVVDAEEWTGFNGKQFRGGIVSKF